MAKTSKDISTISYNSIEFLKQTLDTLIICKVISYYEFIYHLPDLDEKKPHIHLFIMPNKSLDLSCFGDYFIEKDLNNELPLKCMPFRSSKYGDWYWYSLHDKDYLKAKQLKRNTFYNDSDIISSDYDFHKVLVCENPLINFAVMSDLALRDYIFNCVSNGVSLRELLATTKFPLGKVQSVISFYNAMAVTYSPPKVKKYKEDLDVVNELNIDKDLVSNLSASGFHNATRDLSDDIVFD